MIQAKRKSIWQAYYSGLETCCNNNGVKLPLIPDYATNNGHMFYLVCSSLRQRTALIEHLKNNNIHAVFHYLSLNKSPYYQNKHDGRILVNSDLYTDQLVRLPFYYELSTLDVESIIDSVKTFFNSYE
jgi:dTDP-4-amino-4,6-dideoxygalactose transaminase